MRPLIPCHFSTDTATRLPATVTASNDDGHCAALVDGRRSWAIAPNSCSCISGRVQLNVKPGVWISLEVEVDFGFVVSTCEVSH